MSSYNSGSEDWGSVRGCCDIIADAIHAVATDDRSADDIWEDPSPAEDAEIQRLILSDLRNNAYPDEQYEPGDKLPWGAGGFKITREADGSLGLAAY